MWPPSRTFFGLLFLISAPPLQAQEAGKASVEEEQTHLLTNPAQGIVEKFLTTRSGDGEGEREGREVELTTTTTKEGSIISAVSSYSYSYIDKNIKTRFYEHFLFRRI